jgi:hypothetical protein
LCSPGVMTGGAQKVHGLDGNVLIRFDLHALPVQAGRLRIRSWDNSAA